MPAPMPLKINHKNLRTWIEVDTSALEHNYKIFRQLAGKQRLMAVIKSNAYGHGLVGCGKFFNKIGADWFGVDSAPEALTLRRERISKPILVLGYTLPANLEVMASHEVRVTVSTFETLNDIKNKKKILSAEGRKLIVHVKIDTGMHRQGFLLEQVSEVIKILKQMPYVKVEGVYTHLAEPASKKFDAKTKKQFDIFDEAVSLFEQAGFDLIKHTLATPGALAFPNQKYDMVRIGLGLYGVWPNKEIIKRCSKTKLKPALIWKTVISEIKDVKAGEAVGYGFTETLTKKTKLAICPVGYWHGYPRALSSVGQVLIGDKKARIVGRVSMDMIIVDVSRIASAKVGTEVTLLDSHVLATDMAEATNTIGYEIVTRINPLIERFYI